MNYCEFSLCIQMNSTQCKFILGVATGVALATHWGRPCCWDIPSVYLHLCCIAAFSMQVQVWNNSYEEKWLEHKPCVQQWCCVLPIYRSHHRYIEKKRRANCEQCIHGIPDWRRQISPQRNASLCTVISCGEEDRWIYWLDTLRSMPMPKVSHVM